MAQGPRRGHWGSAGPLTRSHFCISGAAGGQHLTGGGSQFAWLAAATCQDPAVPRTCSLPCRPVPSWGVLGAPRLRGDGGLPRASVTRPDTADASSAHRGRGTLETQALRHLVPRTPAALASSAATPAGWVAPHGVIDLLLPAPPPSSESLRRRPVGDSGRRGRGDPPPCPPWSPREAGKGGGGAGRI